MATRGTRGFTLVELLVVIAILGILAAALTTQVTRARAFGRSLRCKANMRNLAQAALGFAIDHSYMPTAGSFEYCDRFNISGRPIYDLNHDNKEFGWVAWTGSGRWPSVETPQAGLMTDSKFYVEGSQSTSPAYHSITNGSLWKYVGRDLATYCCDVHKEYARRENIKVLRSYVMNCYFGYADAKHGQSSDKWGKRREASATSARGSAATLLLFAELPARKIDTSTKGADGVLETKIDDYQKDTVGTMEMIGFNHEVSGSRGGVGGGKRFAAHVAFADGHVDALLEPRGASDSDIKELTRLMCNGTEITRELRTRMK